MSVRPHVGYDEIVDAIRESADAEVVYVHCRGGIGRASTVVGCLLFDSGLDADAALADIDWRRSVTRKAHMKRRRPSRRSTSSARESNERAAGLDELRLGGQRRVWSSIHAR